MALYKWYKITRYIQVVHMNAPLLCVAARFFNPETYELRGYKEK